VRAHEDGIAAVAPGRFDDRPIRLVAQGMVGSERDAASARALAASRSLPTMP